MPDDMSPYRTFSRAEWAHLRADAPMTLSAEEVGCLQSLNDRLSLEDVTEIYLPLSRLLSLYVGATQKLFAATRNFLMAGQETKTPYIIGIAGSVAAGKSTTARVLQALLARWPNTPKVDLVTTDGFLMPNAALQRLGLMERKGFPESYDRAALVRFLTDIKSGRPDILILEGLNVLQAGAGAKGVPFVSDYFDFSVYLDADEGDLNRWYVERFLSLWQTAFRDPQSYFRKYADLSESDAIDMAQGLWNRINLLNLKDNILPTRARASLILKKGADHMIEEVALRRL